MATTKIWKINKRLDHVINYITDLEKTKNSSYGEEFFNLHDNELDNLKSEKECYVSAINCSVDMAYKEMMITKKSYCKESGILGFHAYQSFAGGEVTPEIAHKIGVQLAQEMWGDRFEVVVSTHQNTKHLHNHFVINSVSFKDGKKYYDNHINYARLRKLSDDLCAEYGLKVLKEKKSKAGINYNNFFNKYVTSDYYQMIKDDIDLAILSAYSYRDFLNKLKNMNYEITFSNKILSLKKLPNGNKVRVARTFGYNYQKRNIIKRIEGSSIKDKPQSFFSLLDNSKKKGIYGLFLHYCYLLEVIPKNNITYKLTLEMRKDIKELDSIMEQTNFLVNNQIETDNDLLRLKNLKENQLDLLINKREKMNYKIRKITNEKAFSKLIADKESIDKRVNTIRKELSLIYKIEKRKPIVKENIKNLEEENRKEVDKNESRGRS